MHFKKTLVAAVLGTGAASVMAECQQAKIGMDANVGGE